MDSQQIGAIILTIFGFLITIIFGSLVIWYLPNLGKNGKIAVGPNNIAKSPIIKQMFGTIKNLTKKNVNTIYWIFGILTFIGIGLLLGGLAWIIIEFAFVEGDTIMGNTNSIMDGNTTCFDSSGNVIPCSGGTGPGSQQALSGGDDRGIIKYENIGFGTAIDIESINKWLNPEFAGWEDGNGEQIILSKGNLRTQQGFIPPSFAYFPEGQLSQTYNPDNFQNGRSDCMRACTITNCKALQTEVPQNCYHEVIPIPGVEFTGRDEDGNPIPTNADPNNPQFQNTCGQRASHSCTLFYNTIEEADDAYFNLHTNSPGKMGIKYYEENESPDATPSQGLPSTAPVKWCPATITETTSSSNLYASVSDTEQCSCTNEMNCTNPNCCKMRNLLTTDFARNKFPFYNLPIAVEKTPGTEESICKAVNVDSKGNKTCCGICDDGNGGKKLVSCKKNKCLQGQTNCWHVDETMCVGDLFDKNGVGAVEAMNNFTKRCDKTDSACLDDPSCMLDNGQCFMKQPYDFTSLMNSCFYRNEGCVPIHTQAKINNNNVQFCQVDKVQRGCFGSPNIISVDNSGEIGACSDNSIIPATQRCILDPLGCQPTPDNPDKCLCTGFPYGCGTQFGSNRLWIRRD